VPPGRVGKDPQLLAPAAVPVYFHRLPGHIGAFRPGLQAALALALQGFRAALTLRVRRWLVLERGIPAQARNPGHLALHAGQRQ
jgi:hypothetical protein